MNDDLPNSNKDFSANTHIYIDENNNVDDIKEKILFELASQQRLEIFVTLAKKRAKLSYLSQKLCIPLPEIHRNITRLQEVRLIKRDSEGMFYLTTYGNAVVKQISTLDFLSKHLKYFNEHSLDELPLRFIQSIGTLENCKFVNGITNVLETWQKLIENADEYFYCIIPQFGGSLTDLAMSNFTQKNLKFKIIVPKHAITGKRYLEIKEKWGFDDLVAKKIMERRMVDEVQIAVLINEKQATIDLPFDNGQTDFNNLFYSDNILFHEWCLDYFQYRWHNSNFFDEAKLNISD